jgi:hypothetical protein
MFSSPEYQEGLNDLDYDRAVCLEVGEDNQDALQVRERAVPRGPPPRS